MFPVALVVVFLFPIPFTYHILVYGGYLKLRNPDNVYEGYRLDVDETETGVSLNVEFLHPSKG